MIYHFYHYPLLSSPLAFDVSLLCFIYSMLGL